MSCPSSETASRQPEEPDGSTPLCAAVQQAFDAACARWAVEYGTGARAELLQRSAPGLLSLDGAASVAHFVAAEQALRARYGQAALAKEWRDEQDRDAAMASDVALVAYQSKWETKLRKLQASHAPRWLVPGLSPEEVRDALTLRLIEALRADAMTDAPVYRAGKEWGLLIVQRHLQGLRKSFRLGATLMDFRDVSLLEGGPSQEERWLELEADACRAQAHESARRQLSSPQRQWLAAMKFAAHCGQFFQASDELNLSAASRVLGKHRSSALRAYKELQTHFIRELQALQ